ncbi:MAG: phosphoribosylaminoimidazolesuccinocarboxamide synthase [Gammaproteobacteria bacterium]|jgi:phosphoribosylaminoimidazole-succinocarboxamide synthase
MKKLALISKGKSKSLYHTDNPSELIMEFRDDITAFNAEKFAQLADKAKVNNDINTFLMNYLEQHGIATHLIKRLNDTEALVKPLKMAPIEAVVRNYAAGNLCKRYGIEKGRRLQPPLFEFFLKNDALGDPPLRDEHILSFGLATAEDIAEIKQLTLRVNELLVPLFAKAGFWLVDFKLEFGRDANGQLILGDELSPDGCRIWDAKTQEIYDKDRFRQDLGQVIEHYKVVAQRLGIN